SDPDVAALAGEIKAAQDELTKVKSVARQPNDPSRRAVEKHLRNLMDQWALSWDQKREAIEEKLLAEEGKLQPSRWKDEIAKIQLTIDKQKKQKDSLTDRLKSLNVESKNTKSDTVTAGMISQDLGSLLRMQDLITQKLEQLDFETKQDVYRITLH